MDAVRVLVVYGSTRGGTAGLAHLVADAFVRHHIRAEVRRAGDVRELEDYDAVVVGGALYNNRWHPDATSFVSRHSAELRQLPVWFFSSGPLDDSARSGALAPVPQVNALARDIEIRGHMTFGGLLDKRPAGLFGLFAWGPEGDFRDRHHVAEWVERVAEDLGRESESMVRLVDSTGAPVAPANVRRPAVVILPARRPLDDVEAPDAPRGGDEVIDIRTDSGPSVASERVEDKHLPASAGGLSRLRHYLALEEEPDDEGLDLLIEADQ